MKDPVCSSVGKFCYHKKLINFCENYVKKAIGHTGTQEVEGQNPPNPTQATRMAAGSYIKLEVYDRLYRVYFYFIFTFTPHESAFCRKRYKKPHYFS